MGISLNALSINSRAANQSLLITTVAYLLLNGAQLFETAVLVPVWTAAPPASLHLFQGQFGLDFKSFWIVAHSLHELTFLAALLLNWKIAPRRRVLIVVLVIHMIVRAWTLLYFAPVIISFQQTPFSATIDQTLQEKAALWRTLNVIRVAIFTLLSFALIPLNRIGSETRNALSQA